MKWLLTRIVALFFVLLYGIFHGDNLSGIVFSEFHMLLSLVMGAVGVPVTLSIQLINPLNRDSWLVPNWYSQILSLNQPPTFFHFGSWLSIAYGIGRIINSGFVYDNNCKYAIATLCFGIGGLIGLKISQNIFRRKFQTDD
jgi:hypothetical protein